MSKNIKLLQGDGTTDKEIPGYNRYLIVIAAFFAMFVISPYEYAWSAMSLRLGTSYHWSHEQIAFLFTLFVICQSVGMLPGGMLMDRFGPRWTIGVSGLFSGLGILALALGPNYPLVACLWCVGSFFTGFIYNGTVSTANKWFADKRGPMVGFVAGAFSWGSLPFIFPIRAIPHQAPNTVFLHVIYVMAAITAVVSIAAASIMRNPPAGWRPVNHNPQAKAAGKMAKHQYTVRQALQTWQMWILVISFVLISSAGLTGISKIVEYSDSFKFTTVAATATAGGIAIANGFGKLIIGWLSEHFGCENTMIVSYTLCGLLLFVTIFAGVAQDQILFVCAAIAGIFFWASLFSLFPITIGHYFGEAAAGGNYGVLYALAKGLGGVYGGILSAILIEHSGFPFAFGIAGLMAIASGLILIPLKLKPLVWNKPLDVFDPIQPDHKVTQTVQ